MATTVLEPATFTAAQWLMDRARGRGMVVSCYADTSITGIRSLWRQHFRRELHEIESRIGSDTAARQELAKNVSAILAVLGGRAARRGKSLAVFASVAQGFARTFVLETSVIDRLVVDEEPYILPLLEYLHRQRRYLVVHTDSQHGRIYSGGRGPVQLIAEVIEFTPRKQASSGERWGKQQATIARHREDHLLHFRKALIRELSRAWPEERYEGLMLFGEHVVLAHLRKALPPSLADRVAFEGPLAFVGGTRRLQRQVESAIDEQMRTHDRRVIEDVRTRLAEHQNLAKGAQAVIDALRSDQVSWPGFVVMSSDRGARGRRCTGCGSVFDRPEGACPYCSASCQTVNLWQEIALLAARHNIPVHFVGPGADLDHHGGVIAVLAREQPWQTAPAPSPALATM